MVTSVYEIQIVNKEKEVVSFSCPMYNYSKALAYMEEHPITNPDEHYKVIRTDTVEGEEVSVEVVYEQETSEKENDNGNT